MKINFELKHTKLGWYSFNDKCQECSHIIVCKIRQSIMEMKQQVKVSLECDEFLKDNGKDTILFTTMNDIAVPTERKRVT